MSAQRRGVDEGIRDRAGNVRFDRERFDIPITTCSVLLQTYLTFRKQVDHVGRYVASSPSGTVDRAGHVRFNSDEPARSRQETRSFVRLLCAGSRRPDHMPEMSIRERRHGNGAGMCHAEQVDFDRINRMGRLLVIVGGPWAVNTRIVLPRGMTRGHRRQPRSDREQFPRWEWLQRKSSRLRNVTAKKRHGEETGQSSGQ